MRVNDFMLVLLVMFLNQITIAFWAFNINMAEIFILVVLAALNVVFLLTNQRFFAALFISIALLNSTIMFVANHEFMNVIVTTLNLIMLYYLITETTMLENRPKHTQDPSKNNNAQGADYLKIERTIPNNSKMAYKLYYEEPDFFKHINEIERDIDRKIGK